MEELITTLHWEPKQKNIVQCQLCPHYCTLIPNQIGKCGVRINHNGTLFSNVLDKCISTHVDPIEKKPLYHFHPGSKAYSLATMGCNFSCDWCQNWQISQLPSINGIVFGESISAKTHIHQALKSKCDSIAYTYTEPTVFYEYALNIMKHAQEAHLHNIFVTNGFIAPNALKDLLPHLSAANIDLKAFSNTTYQKHINGRLEPVLEAMRIMKKAGVWIEITTLLIPTINDSNEEILAMAKFIHDELGADTPWHLSRFLPQHRLKHLHPTSLGALKRAKQIAKNIGIQHVYIGNVASEPTHTYCVNCNKILVQRTGYATYLPTPIKNNNCPHCGESIQGHWS